jgi:transcription elongation factor GreA
MELNYISAEGLAAMQAELHHMKSVLRHEIANRIETAKELGDLRENADYQHAKEDLAMLETKIQQYDAAIARARIIEKHVGDKVQIGSTATIRTKDGKERVYQIVGAREASPVDGRISNESPIGQALLGKKVGDEVEMKVPAGVIIYTVVEIK